MVVPAAPAATVYAYDERERLFTGHTGRLFLVVTGLWLCLSLTNRLLPPLLPAIIADLAISATLAGLAMTGFRVASAAVEYPSGRVADDHSRTFVLVVCVGLSTLGIAMLAVSTTYVLFLAALLVFGIGRGMYAPASRALLSDMYRRRRGAAFGINMMGSELAGILAAGIAILIVAVATWRAAFAPLALAVLPLLIGFAVLSREPMRFGGVRLGVRETGARILADPALRWVLVVYCLYVLAATGVSTFLPLFLIEVHDASFAVASGAFAMLYVMGILAKPASGYLSDVLPRLLVAGGSLVVAAAGLGLLVAAPVVPVAIAAVAVYAVGYRGLPPGLQAYLMDRFPDESMAGDLGAMRTVYLSVGALGPAYAGLAADTVGFVAAFVSFMGCYAVASVLLLWLSRS